MGSPVVLVVDDEAPVRDMLGRLAAAAGFEVRPCGGGLEAIEFLRSHQAQMAFVDVNMPDVGGIEVLRAIKDVSPQCHVIVMSGISGVDAAVEAIKLGATDFLSKPFDFTRLREILETERREIDRRRRLLAQEARLIEDLEFCGMVGRSAVMQEVFELIQRVAPHVRTTLVTGETGTGKELVAQALHTLGPRRNGRLVTMNCSAVVETLFESELFGHRRGAFTGAVDTKIGLFEQADRGTLFLDEIGELPLAMQAKLLRILETGEVQRVGDTTAKTVDVRIVAATNRDLRGEIAAGRFRSDLYYRLNVMEIHVPPLRERKEDIPLLVAAFVRNCATRLEKRMVGTTAGAERLLMSAAWEGNVRELRNVIERACILADTEFLTERDVVKGLPPVDLIALAADAASIQAGNLASPAGESPQSLTVLERAHVRQVMEEVGGNKSTAAVRLGLSRRALYRRLDRLGLSAH